MVIEYIWNLNIFCALVRIKIQRMLQCTTNQILMSNLELLQPWFWWQNRNLDYRKLVPKYIFHKQIRRFCWYSQIMPSYLNMRPWRKLWWILHIFDWLLFDEDFKFLQSLGTLFSIWNCESTGCQIRSNIQYSKTNFVEYW